MGIFFCPLGVEKGDILAGVMLMQVRGPPASGNQERIAYAQKRKETEPDDGSRKTKKQAGFAFFPDKMKVVR